MHEVTPALVAGLLALGPGFAVAPDLNAAPRSERLVAPPELLTPHTAPAPRVAGGLGFFAVSKDRAIDLGQIGQPVLAGPVGSPFAAAAGLGFRRENVSAMAGYLQPEAARSGRNGFGGGAGLRREPAHLGLALALHF